MPVAVYIDESKVRIVPVDVRRRGERSEALPILFFRSLIEARGRALKDHTIELPVARKVQKLMTWRRLGQGGEFCDLGQRLKSSGGRGLAVCKVMGEGAQI